MSFEGTTPNNKMLDSLKLQLRDAEMKRAVAERAHQEAVEQLRAVSSGLNHGSDTIEALKSRTRELEKKATLEIVRCEELQLELSAALKSKQTTDTTTRHPKTATSGNTSTITWAPTPLHLVSHNKNDMPNHLDPKIVSSSKTSSNNNKLTYGRMSGKVGAASEIDRIIAKIEQDNRILAELEYPRTTGASLSSPNNHILSKDCTLSGIPENIVSTGNTGVGDTMSSSLGLMTWNGPGSSVNTQQINTIPTISQSSTMPVLSLHNSYTLPSGSASYTLGLSGAPNVASYSYRTSAGVASDRLMTGTALGVPNICSTGALTGLSASTVNPFAYTTYANPLLTTSAVVSTIRKPYDDLDLIVGGRYGPRPTTPTSPIVSGNWGLESLSGLDGVNPAFIHTQPHLRLGALDLETRHGYSINGNGEPQVDMLDIPGKGRCCVFIARFSYDPPDDAEGELALSTGDYLLVWGSGEPQGGYYDAELLDGRRGLVPASFVQRLVGDDLLEFHQAVVSTLRDADEILVPLDPAPLPPNIPQSNPLLIHTSEDLARLNEVHNDIPSDQNEDEASDNVPAPQHLSLEKQLNKSVLIGWAAPDPPGNQIIESYHVYIDGVLKVTVKANERTRALVEGVDLNRPHRISVRSVTHDRHTSRDAACTMIIGRDTAHLGPSAVKASNITCSSAVISWLPANTNHQHVVCVNNVEVKVVKPGVYRQTITGLSPSSQYRVTVRAKHSRATGQTSQIPPPEEAPGAYTDFRTLTKGLPDPPQDIQVEAGPQDGTLLVTWSAVSRPPSSGPVTGYAVYADGKKVTDVDSPTGDHALIDIGKLVGLNPRMVTVRTKSRESTSSDSQPTVIPNSVRNAARTRNINHHQQQQQQQQQTNFQQTSIPPHMRNQQHQQQSQRTGPMVNQQNVTGTNHQQILDHHDENLSDKEIFPGSILQGHNMMNRSGMVGGNMTNQQQNNMQHKPQQPYSTQSSDQQQQSSGIFSTATNFLSGASNAATGGLFGNRQNYPKGPQVIPQGISQQQQQHQQQQQQQPQQQQQQQPQQQQQQQFNSVHSSSGGIFGFGSQQNQQQHQSFNNMPQAGGAPGQPNLMQKLGDITAPGGDILSKGKELIFMKFGLGGK